jgi:hypothetical protein
MYTAIAHLRGTSPYSQGRAYDAEVPALPKELKGDYEERTWRYRCHANADGNVTMPATSFAECVKEAAKRLKIQIPGKGRVEYAKYFEAGIMCVQDAVLPVKRDNVICQRLFVPSDGVKGSGKRVWKNFPLIPEWESEITFYIFDDIIKKEVFEQVLRSAGNTVGVGRFRPQKGGTYGRFEVLRFSWQDSEG